MVDVIRCQMCGKLNPSDIEVCQYCRARLKPLVAPQSDKDSSEQSNLSTTVKASLPPEREDKSFDLSYDFLDENNTGGDEESNLDQASEEDESNNWISNIRYEVKGGTDALEPLDGNGLLEKTGAEYDEKRAQGADSDWFKRLDNPEDRTPLEEKLVVTLPESANKPGQDDLTNSVTESLRSDLDLDAWLAKLDTDQVDETRPDTEKKELSITTGQVNGEDQLSIPASAEPDQLQAESNETSAEISMAGELPDWLKNLEEELPPAPTIAEPDKPLAEAVEVSQEGELPDWLANLEEERLSDTAAAEPEKTLAEPVEASLADELPDWLRNLEEEQLSASKTVEPEKPLAESVEANKVEGLTDWLTSPEEEQPLATTIIEPDSALAEPVEASTAEELPEWLKNLQGEQSLSPVAGRASEPSLKTKYEDNLPDWLKGFEDVGKNQAEAEVTEETSSGQTNQSTASKEDRSSDYGVIEIGLPKWQEDVFASTGADSADKQPADKQADISSTELPGWLETMRPDGDITSKIGAPIGAGIMEDDGPLAGLHGVLPINSDVESLKKPPAYVFKMHLSKQQRERASILSKMLAAEEEASPLSLPSPMVSQRLVRWVIALLLLIASFIPIISGTQQMSLPVPASEIQQVSQIVEKITPGTPVLLAIDYEPGLSGEMDAAASAVIDHLMVRGAALVLVSTSPTGPILAERFIQKIQIEHRYKSGQQYFNLGYIPGGATGLLSLAGGPQRTLPYSFDGLPVWNQMPLQKIEKLSDFPLVLVVVDDPETARNWVEQVVPYLGQTPMVMVTSAQAEPMVRPYYEGNPRQIQGIIVGLSGGSAYERMTGLNGLGRTYWDAFGGEMLLVVVIIWVGALVSGVLYIKDKRKAEKPGTGTNTRGVSKGSVKHA